MALRNQPRPSHGHGCPGTTPGDPRTLARLPYGALVPSQCLVFYGTWISASDQGNRCPISQRYPICDLPHAKKIIAFHKISEVMDLVPEEACLRSGGAGGPKCTCEVPQIGAAAPIRPATGFADERREGRTIFRIGKPLILQREAGDQRIAWRAGESSVTAGMRHRPGARCPAAHDTARAVIGAAGHAAAFRKRIGYSVGIASAPGREEGAIPSLFSGVAPGSAGAGHGLPPARYLAQLRRLHHARAPAASAYAPATSATSWISTGAFPGRVATPTAARAPMPWAPNSARRKAEAWSASLAWASNPGSAAM